MTNLFEFFCTYDLYYKLVVLRSREKDSTDAKSPTCTHVAVGLSKESHSSQLTKHRDPMQDTPPESLPVASVQLRKLGDQTQVIVTIGTGRVSMSHMDGELLISSTANGQTLHAREDLGEDFSMTVRLPNNIMEVMLQ